MATIISIDVCGYSYFATVEPSAYAINNPAIIMADEPTGNLDTKSSYEIMDIFKYLNEQGKTVVMVTHEPDIAEQTKRILVMRDGKLVSDERR